MKECNCILEFGCSENHNLKKLKIDKPTYTLSLLNAKKKSYCLTFVSLYLVYAVHPLPLTQT